MNPEEPMYTRPDEHVSNTLPVTQPGERLICEIKRHPIGIITTYVVTGLLLIVIAVVCLIIVPQNLSATDADQAKRVGLLIFLAATIACFIYDLIATKVYWSNSWAVTTDSVTQVDQLGLFERQSSQLSMANIEDVTAEQNGLLTHVFNYGVLKAETAGHRSKFVFLYCPNPNFYAQKILAAREAFEQYNKVEESIYQQAPQATPTQQPPPGPQPPPAAPTY